MKRRLPRKKDQIQSDYVTYALSDTDTIDPETGTTIPSEKGVKEAKDWVDANEK